MITKAYYGTYLAKDAYKYTLIDNGIQVEICDFGAAILSVKLNTKLGVKDICLSYPTIESYINSGAYCGATVGRIANRIKGARFKLNGVEYKLSANENGNQLHGGKEGFAYRFWQAEICGNVLKLYLNSKNGDQGFPGELNVKVEYEIVENRLEIRYYATADSNTVFAPTNHAYFNLNGEDGENILSTHLKINADKFTPLDAEHIPTGEIISVKNTPFDFTQFKPIGSDICAKDAQLIYSKGYDCNFILNGNLAAIAKSEKSGVQLSVYTNMPAMQFYSGNYLSGKGKTRLYTPRQGFCLEPQFVPNSVNLNNFEKPLLKKGEEKSYYIYYKFDIDNDII